MNRGEIFEARLIPYEDSFIFSNLFCFHPLQVTKYILREVKTIKRDRGAKELVIAKELLIHKLFKMRCKLEHYKHIAIEEIYTNEFKLR